MSKNLKEWNLKPHYTEFAYNGAPTYAASHFPFDAYYEVNPLSLMDLLPLPIKHIVRFQAQERTKEMKKLHEQIRAQLEKVNASCKVRTNKH